MTGSAGESSLSGSTTPPDAFRLTYPARPWTTNAERKGNHWERASATREWREAFGWLARQARIPRLKRIGITVEVTLARGRLQDTAACHPAVKAAIDGLVDAGVIADDTGDYVAWITFRPPTRGADALHLTIESLEGTTHDNQPQLHQREHQPVSADGARPARGARGPRPSDPAGRPFRIRAVAHGRVTDGA